MDIEVMVYWIWSVTGNSSLVSSLFNQISPSRDLDTLQPWRHMPSGIGLTNVDKQKADKLQYSTAPGAFYFMNRLQGSQKVQRYYRATGLWEDKRANTFLGCLFDGADLLYGRI